MDVSPRCRLQPSERLEHYYRAPLDSTALIVQQNKGKLPTMTCTRVYGPAEDCACRQLLCHWQAYAVSQLPARAHPAQHSHCGTRSMLLLNHFATGFTEQRLTLYSITGSSTMCKPWHLACGDNSTRIALLAAQQECLCMIGSIALIMAKQRHPDSSKATTHLESCRR